MCDPPDGLATPVPVDPAGLRGPTRGQARGPGWRKTSHGLFVASSVDPDVPEQRVVEAAARLRSGGAVTGWAACRMHGAAFFDGLADGGRRRLAVPLACGPFHQLRRVPGDDLIRDILNPWEIVDVQGVPCTTPARATFDAMRYASSTRAAVVALDMMAAAGLTTVAEMREYVGRKQAWTGVQRCRDAVALGDDNSWSPPESRLRLVWELDAGRGRPLTNRPLFDLRGRLLGYPDLLDPEAGVVGEYDGAEHLEVEEHTSDLDREGGLRDHRLEVVRFTGPDMRVTPRVVRRIHAGYSRAHRLVPEQRTWTLTPPPGWRPVPRPGRPAA